MTDGSNKNLLEFQVGQLGDQMKEVLALSKDIPLLATAIANLSEKFDDYMDTRDKSCPYRVEIAQSIQTTNTLNELQRKLLFTAVLSAAGGSGATFAIIKLLGA